jgi:hypothetical protein
MKKLDKKFNKKGFTYTEIVREKNKAIYKQSKTGQTHTSYEVVKIGSHNGYELNGSKIAAAETYPSTSLWGIQGWTFQDLDEAKKKFKKIS